MRIVANVEGLGLGIRSTKLDWETSIRNHITMPYVSLDRCFDNLELYADAQRNTAAKVSVPEIGLRVRVLNP